MEVFATKQKSHYWHYITPKNLHSFLQEFPYRQNDKLFAYCPYCSNPIQIVEKINQSELDDPTFYGRHLLQSPEGMATIDINSRDHCLLRQKKPFSPTLTTQNHFSIRNINVVELQKAFTQYTGIYFSRKLAYQILGHLNTVAHWKGVDDFDLPFALLLATKQINLYGRKVANQHLKNGINNSDDFFVDSKEQILSLNKKAKLYLKIKLGINKKAEWSFLSLKAIDSCNKHQAIIYQGNRYCGMSKNIFLKERN